MSISFGIIFLIIGIVIVCLVMISGILSIKLGDYGKGILYLSMATISFMVLVLFLFGHISFSINI